MKIKWKWNVLVPWVPWCGWLFHLLSIIFQNLFLVSTISLFFCSLLLVKLSHVKHYKRSPLRPACWHQPLSSPISYEVDDMVDFFIILIILVIIHLLVFNILYPCHTFLIFLLFLFPYFFFSFSALFPRRTALISFLMLVGTFEQLFPSSETCPRCIFQLRTLSPSNTLM